MRDLDTLMRGFQMGPWTVLPERGLLKNGDDEKHIEPLVMDVLVALALRGGDVVRMTNWSMLRGVDGP